MSSPDANPHGRAAQTLSVGRTTFSSMNPVSEEQALAPPPERRAQKSALDLSSSHRPRSRPTPALEEAVALGKLLRPAEQWRLWCELKDQARYLDIETLGLALDDPITMVGVGDGLFASVLVAGRDLTAQRLAQELSGARLLVTFAGTSFDLPRLRRAFPTLPWDLPHLDLAISGRHVGLRGGLKAVERALGWRRPAELSACDGKEAVRLWRRHQAGERGALLKLIRYCRADVASLPGLAAGIVARLAAAEEEARGGAAEAPHWLARS